MFSFPLTGKSPSTAKTGRLASRMALAAGLTLTLVLLGYREPAPDAAPMAAGPPAEPDSAMSPALIQALADMRYGLKHADIENYRRLFAAADSADWGGVQAMAGLIQDRRLIGHALAARYLAPESQPSFADLRGWLDLYADYPEADDIYRRALAERPANTLAAIPQPRDNDDIDIDLSDSEVPGPAEPRTGAGDRAFTRFFSSDDKGALADAMRAIEQLGEKASTSRWIAGLAAWRLGHFAEAEQHFAQLAGSRFASAWMTAAGAYWAGRVEERNGSQAAAAKWFGSASRFPTTFYGLLALRKLGLDISQRATASSISANHLDILAETPAGYRAIALLEIGRRAMAADELERIDATGDPRMEEAVIVVAGAANLGQFSPSLAQRIAQPAEQTIRRRYPIPDWRPRGGFRIDPALVYALARQESRFDATALSPAGAAGLMQIMPDTATAVAPKEQRSLFDPSTNLDVGQRYIRALMRDPKIGDNLLLLAVAYNGGSGNPAKFRRMLIHDDPLLAVESIPADSTREYIKHVIANYWIYSARLGGDTTSLTDLAEGRWPLYHWDDALDGGN
jgi:soluble lytic murein transglycosylase-like protein